jgi:pyruvate/2-oxoglutarate dehydrogenase complex dihydrolipoamide dehydrogenase (E3) component
VMGTGYDVLVLGSGTDSKRAAWTMAQEGKRTAVVERKYISVSSTNIGRLPSKNAIHTIRVASHVGRHQEFGLRTGSVPVNMAGVYARSGMKELRSVGYTGSECQRSSGERVATSGGTY